MFPVFPLNFLNCKYSKKETNLNENKAVKPSINNLKHDTQMSFQKESHNLLAQGAGK